MAEAGSVLTGREYHVPFGTMAEVDLVLTGREYHVPFGINRF
jgi:hypothetical protein